MKQLETDYLPAIAGLADVMRSRLYEIDEKISNIKTGEREIYEATNLYFRLAKTEWTGARENA